MAQRTIIKIITVLVFAVIIGTPLFYQKAGIFPYTLGKALFFQAVVELVFAFWLILAIFNKEYRPKRTPLMIALAAFVGALLITALFGVDFHRSFWSTYERGFGVFTIMHLAALTVVLSSLGKKLPWKWIFYVSLGTALLVSVLAILQLNIKNLLLEEPTPNRPGATFGNPSFMAGYLLFHIFLAVYLFFGRIKSGIAFKGKEVAIYIYLACAFLVTVAVLFLTQTRGDILGLAAAVSVLLIMFAWRPPETSVNFLSRRKLYVVLIAVVIVAGSAFWFTRANSFWGNIPALGRFASVSLDDMSLQPRIIAARAAWRGFLDNPVLGVGWDNFNIVFNKYYDPRALRLGYQETRFDKPHNFFLEDMASGGVVLTFARLALLAAFIWQSSKLKDRLLGQIFIAVTVGYFVRNLFIFDTIGPAFALFMFLGYVDGRFMVRQAHHHSTNHHEQGRMREETRGSSLEVDRNSTGTQENAAEIRRNMPDKKIDAVTATAIIASAFLFAYMVNIRSLQASNYHFRGFIDMVNGRTERSVQNFRKVLDIWSPYRWNFVRDYAAVMAETHFYNPGAISEEVVLGAIKEMERVTEEHPKDAFNHYFLVDLYNQTSDLDSSFLDKAEKEAEIALKLSPNRQQVIFSLAKTKTLKGDYDIAVTLAREALALDEEVADSHFYYGLLSFAQGDQTTGYEEIKTAIKMGKRFRSFYEPLTIANFFADYGKIEEALEFYQKAYTMKPDDLEVQIKTGVAHFMLGRREDARVFLEKAGARFNFRESPAFADLKPILDELGVGY